MIFSIIPRLPVISTLHTSINFNLIYHHRIFHQPVAINSKGSCSYSRLLPFPSLSLDKVHIRISNKDLSVGTNYYCSANMSLVLYYQHPRMLLQDSILIILAGMVLNLFLLLLWHVQVQHCCISTWQYYHKTLDLLLYLMMLRHVFFHIFLLQRLLCLLFL